MRIGRAGRMADDGRRTRLSGVVLGEGTEKILRGAAQADRPGDLLAHDPKRLDRILTETRRRGYATRNACFTGGSYEGHPYDDGLAAIAIALSDGTRVYGSINILWIKKAFTVEEFAGQHLADLQDAAREIVNSLQGPQSRRLN